MTASEEIEALRDELRQLRAEVAELREGRTPSSAVDVASSEGWGDVVSRRGWMKAAAGAAVVGAALAMGDARPVAADDPDDITLGMSKTTQFRTQANYAGPAGGLGFMFQSGTAYSNAASPVAAALGGWTSKSTQSTGVSGLTSVSSSVAFGVHGRASGTSGTGVAGQGPYGLSADGTTSALRLLPRTQTMPHLRSNTHFAGEIDVVGTSGEGEVWLCVMTGTPGVWRKIGGPSTAGALHALEPFRAYDSRHTTPLPGALNPGQNRVVSVKDSRDLDTGAVLVADRIPAGATAIAYNVTITNTVRVGFLSVTPGSSVELSASSINWSSSGQDLANSSIVALDDSRQIKAFCGGVAGASTDFVIDITGYYF